MVDFNRLTKSSGNGFQLTAKKPRKIAFKIDEYETTIHKQRIKNPKYIHLGIWKKSTKIGAIELYKIYGDVDMVFSADTKIEENHQGKNIAYKIYETLVIEKNLAIQSGNQSKGAVKLWKKLKQHENINVYFINDSVDIDLFKCDIFQTKTDKLGNLEGIDYANKDFNPYKKTGSLLLTKKNSSLDITLMKQLIIRKQIAQNLEQFKKHDRISL